MPSRPRKAIQRPRSKWAWHRRTLLALRRRFLQEHLEKMRESLGQAEPARGDPPADEREADDFPLALLAREQDALNEINDALERIEQGTYGVCEVTGLPIPAARLRAVPWARQLRSVAQFHEHTPHRTGRPE